MIRMAGNSIPGRRLRRLSGGNKAEGEGLERATAKHPRAADAAAAIESTSDKKASTDLELAAWAGYEL